MCGIILELKIYLADAPTTQPPQCAKSGGTPGVEHHSRHPSYSKSTEDTKRDWKNVERFDRVVSVVLGKQGNVESV
jgi:hypothetical protein